MHVRVVSPSSPTSLEKIEEGVHMMEAQGYRVSLGEHVFERRDYLAGSDEQRAADLMSAFASPEVDAVMCSRGGYGCARLLPHLDFDAMAASGKMFCGFSDVTTLHIALNNRGLATFHMPMLLTFSVDRPDWVRQSWLNLLSGENPIVDGAPSGECLVGGLAEGPLGGGCLVLMTDSLGTKEEIETADKLLLIEDVNEDPHRVDAMLTHLLNAGKLQDCAGLIVGEMTGTDERRDESIGARSWREIVSERLTPLGIPCIVDYPIGHKRAMLSLPLGVGARLDADAGTLELLEPPCKTD